MTKSLGYQNAGDIGGAMDLSAGYRWNVPQITYGFDQSFIDYFGANGVQEVEKAIGLLNALPPASSINSGSYPLSSKGLNFQAQSQGLIDLKSLALSLLLEQMGLNSPYNGFALQSVIFETGNVPGGTVLIRNYDPLILASTNAINGVHFNYQVNSGSGGSQQYNLQLDQIEINSVGESAIAGISRQFPLSIGQFSSSLTYDDAGGLRYLLSASNTNVESLLPNVSGTGPNQGNYVNTAIRPGVEKITFIPHTVSSADGTFLKMTNSYTDTYIFAGVTNQQLLARVITQPDILFSMANIDLFDRTGTTNWVNNASLNGNSSGAGPGVIQPGAVIRFSRMGANFTQSDPGALAGAYFIESPHWGSFDGSANAPVRYPLNSSISGTTIVKLHLNISFPNSGITTTSESLWPLPAQPTGGYQLQTSMDLINWNVITNLPNSGFFHSCTIDRVIALEGFFRLVPAPVQ